MTKTIQIQGMSCSHCALAATKALSAVSGVTKATVDLATQTAVLETDGTVTEEALKTAVEDEGFTLG